MPLLRLAGALVLVVMGGVGYVWIRRQLPANAQSQLTARVPVYGQLSFLNREGKSEDTVQGRDEQGRSTSKVQAAPGVHPGEHAMCRESGRAHG